MSEILVQIPNNFLPERKYILNVLLSEYLGVDYCVEVSDGRDYVFEIEYDKKVVVHDFFFSLLKNEEYLSKNNLPEVPRFVENILCPETDIPVLYGNPIIKVSSVFIDCEIDIFASSFFLLTRWEEYVSDEKDKHGRFPDKFSYLQKCNLHYRPIVNEYVELFWNFLVELGYKGERKHQEFKIIPTHDVDDFARYDNPKKIVKALAGDLLKRNSFKLFLNTIKDVYGICKGKLKDPYDNFDFLMNISDEFNVKSEFYFIPGENGETDVKYNFLSDNVISKIRKILESGHIVGYHAGMDTYSDESQFKLECNRLRKIVPHPVSGRQHYLKFSAPFTWRFWNANGFKYDSTICYANDIGFRAGVAREYPVFDFLKREQLDLIERPTIVMESALLQKHNNVIEFENTLLTMRDLVKKYHGQFVFLWHPDNFNVQEWNQFTGVYRKIFDL